VNFFLAGVFFLCIFALFVVCYSCFVMHTTFVNDYDKKVLFFSFPGKCRMMERMFQKYGPDEKGFGDYSSRAESYLSHRRQGRGSGRRIQGHER
jgi:hypothetical protein